MAAQASDPAQLIQQLKQLIQNPDSLSDEDKTGKHGVSQRAELSRVARLASIALETREESMHRTMFTYLPLVTGRISQEFNIFTTLAKGSEANPVELSTLVEASGLDKNLVSSVMDYHCYQGAAIEPKQGFYAPTKLTNNMLEPQFAKAITAWHDILGPAYGALHRLLKNGPDQAGQKTAFQVGQHTTNTYYEWLESHPEQHAAFYGYMGAMHVVAAVPKWTDVVNFDEEIARDAKANEPVFVDIGGGDGSQCVEAQRVHKLGGKTILQDRANVIEKASKAREAGVETQVYDFFTEQPIKGARAYFIQFVLLNWDNDDCVRMLASQASAMSSQSTLMIVDYVQGHRWEREGGPLEPDLYTPAVALSARTCHDAKGRGRADYRELLERAGLELTDIRVFTNFGQAVIMAKKPMAAP